MFEKASREQYRYPSIRGDLTTEQLWLLPLSSKAGFDLDSVAKTINRDLKEQAEESFVAPANNSSRKLLEDKLAIVVHIINIKQAENAHKAASAQRTAERQRLVEILHLRTRDELMAKSPAEIQKMIDDLTAAEAAPTASTESA